MPRATIRSSNNPRWYNKQLMHLKNIRNKEFKKLRTLRTHQPTVLDEREFLSAMGNYEAYRKELHSDYIREKARCVKNDPKSFWRHINSKQ